MKVVMTTVLCERADLVDANLAFHLNAGINLVVATGAKPDGSSAKVLELYSGAGHLVWVDDATQADLARLAVARHGADWVIPSTSEEFWWPRGESFHDVLSVIPPRYGVEQALIRTFAAASTSSGLFAEDRTARTSLLKEVGSTAERATTLLRPVYRAEPDLEIDEEDWTLVGRRIPLRAWYPLEVFRFPSDGAELIVASRVESLLAEGQLVVDARLRDALRQLRSNDGESSYLLPKNGARSLVLPVPTIVDDASYAVECAAVGEVDLVRLDRQIRDLEVRISELEARFWPTVRRMLRRLARRPS